MHRNSALILLSLAGSLGLVLTACDGKQGSMPDPDPSSNPPDLSATSDLAPSPAIDLAPPDPYSWGEATPGVTVGPFGDLKLFRDSCGGALFARFIPRQDFDLLTTLTSAPDGSNRQVNYFTIPHFKDQIKSVHQIGTSYPAGNYSSTYTVRYPAGNQLTYSFQATPENKMYRWPGILTYVSDRMVGSSLYVTVRSTINGTIGSCQLYDANDCPVSGLGFSTSGPNVFIKGQDSEIRCSASAQAGTRYLIVIQGRDSDQQYPFYATLERP